MARDFKLSNFTFTSVSGTTAGALNHTSYTPTGDLANTGTVQNLFVAAAGTSAGQTYDVKQVMGFRNSKIQPIVGTISALGDVTTLQSQLQAIAAGNEVSSIANDPALPGNTSYGEMFMTFNLSWALNGTAANNNIDNGGYFVVEGAYDNGYGAVDSSSYAPVSGPVPLVVPSGNLANVALTSNVFTTVSAHSLKVGDVVVLFDVTGLTGANAKRQMQVFSVPAPNQFTLTTTGGTAVSAITGTPTAGITVYRCLGAAIGGHRAAMQIVPSRRSYYRLALKYITIATAGPQLNLSRVGLTLGRDNASTY